MLFTGENLLKEKERAEESCFTERIDFTKAFGQLIKEKAKAWRGTAMATNTLAISKREKLMEKEFTTGQTEKSTTASGNAESKKAMEHGKESLAIATLDSGKTLKQMVTEFINGRTGIAMKELGRTV